MFGKVRYLKKCSFFDLSSSCKEFFFFSKREARKEKEGEEIKGKGTKEIKVKGEEKREKKV